MEYRKPKFSPIHETPEERLASATEETRDGVKTIESLLGSKENISERIEELKSNIDNPKEVIRKLDEVKSASLVSNRLLKQIKEKETSTIQVQLEGIKVVTLKGDDGEDGEDGYTPIKGVDYLDGEDGEDGKDGSPDTAEDIAKKINTLKRKIDFKVLKNVPQDILDAANASKFPTGFITGNPIAIQNSGTRLPDSYTTINFSTGTSATYANGVITVVGVTNIPETPSGKVDGQNNTFTVLNTPAYITVDRVIKYSGDGYSYSNGTITIIDGAPPVQIIRSHY